MLKGIPSVLSPELLKVLCEMGHGDRIVIGDGNFPAESVGAAHKVIRCDGHSGCELLEAILRVMPLDTYVEKPVTLMQVVPGDKLRLECEIIKRKGPVGVGKATASVDGKAAVTAELTFMIG